MAKRYNVLDAIRGFTLISMVIYHAAWDLVYLFGFDWPWYLSTGAWFWQQSICWTFIFLSGFCLPFGHKKWKRGFTVFLCGYLVTVVTSLAMPESCVRFGVLTLIGSGMLLITPAEGLLKKCSPVFGFSTSLILFALTRNVNEGFLGFGPLHLLALPDFLYRNLFTTYLGFPVAGFRSTDYFSLFPWIFLFASGYFMHWIFAGNGLMRHLRPGRLKPVEWLGRHSLEIYLIHQPALYLIFYVLFD